MEEKSMKYQSFARRHIGPSAEEIQAMLKTIGENSLDSFISKVVPAAVRFKGDFEMPVFKTPLTEPECLARLEELASENSVWRSYIGMGYYGTHTPTVIQRNILENPGWYTQYTPYQPEISQGRLEALLNYQTMIIEMTGLPVANASLLDEGTAAAEAMSVAYHAANKDAMTRTTFLVSDDTFPQTKEIIETRAAPLNINVIYFKDGQPNIDSSVFGVFVQFPTASGALTDWAPLFAKATQAGAVSIISSDLLSLTLCKSPAELGADIAVGTSQRFGIPFGYGGPHAAYFACKDDLKRVIPGRIVGVSKDSNNQPALRLSLQTREQHIRREKATSNICTAQVLLAVMAGMYAAYHGPKGLKEIATKTHSFTADFATNIKNAGLKIAHEQFFDTVTVLVDGTKRDEIIKRAQQKKINLGAFTKDRLTVSLDETVTANDVSDLIEVFTGKRQAVPTHGNCLSVIPESLKRTTEFLTHPIFNRYHSETEFLRYVRKLESRDLSLGTSMIPLGSCTMKLNATTEMVPVTWKAFGGIHPFAPRDQAKGYQTLFNDLEKALSAITGFAAVSLQPNAGSQGEYAGLLVIRAYHMANGQGHRDVCLIPKSAHGTNPASAAMVGMKVVVVNCDDQGNVDVGDLREKAQMHKDNLSALMITYPSTHGVFEASVKEIAEIVHSAGGQVYLDGANLNALVGMVKPGEIGADVCHINLHKTFCIPHGGGGPGMGPIGVAAHLKPYLPGHSVVSPVASEGTGAVSAAPWGSASILPISWSYMAMMGEKGLQYATQIAILNANYVAKRLEQYYPVLYKGESNYVAHECILDLRGLKSAGVEVDDVAKRLMDYGFHAPTVSWPVAGTIMFEPTESESKYELDRYCDALIAIHKEASDIEGGKLDKKNNPLKNAPHTMKVVVNDSWDRPYSREQAAFPAPWLLDYKFWPSVGRIDASYGDRNLVCACLPIEDYQ